MKDQHETTRAEDRATSDKPKRPKRRFLAAASVLGAVAIIVGAALLFRSGPAEGVRPTAQEEGVGSSDPDSRLSVLIPEAATARNPIKLAKVSTSRLAGDIQVVGNVSADADHFAIVGPLVAGRVTRLVVGVGSRVKRGQVMAEVESAEVGDARAALLSAKARLSAADANLRRERELADKRISSAREREIAEAQWATEKAAVRAAEERLRAIGLNEGDIRAVEENGHGGRVPIRAPIDGAVIERPVTLGEAVERATDAFKIADLTHVWVLLDVYEKDLARVRVGQRIEARTDSYPGEIFRGRVAYLAPVIEEATRTAKVRVELDNPAGKLRIGQLVSAKLLGDADAVPTAVVAVPRTAVQRIDGKPLVFVRKPGGFERRGVELGVTGGDMIEIRKGLAVGEEIASDGGFLLKSELLR